MQCRASKSSSGRLLDCPNPLQDARSGLPAAASGARQGLPGSCRSPAAAPPPTSSHRGAWDVPEAPVGSALSARLLFCRAGGPAAPAAPPLPPGMTVRLLRATRVALVSQQLQRETGWWVRAQAASACRSVQQLMRWCNFAAALRDTTHAVQGASHNSASELTSHRLHLTALDRLPSVAASVRGKRLPFTPHSPVSAHTTAAARQPAARTHAGLRSASSQPDGRPGAALAAAAAAAPPPLRAACRHRLQRCQRLPCRGPGRSCSAVRRVPGPPHDAAGSCSGTGGGLPGRAAACGAGHSRADRWPHPRRLRPRRCAWQAGHGSRGLGSRLGLAAGQPQMLVAVERCT